MATPSNNHMEKAVFSYLEVESPNGINLIMFRDSSVTFAKISKKKKKKKIRCIFE